MCWFSVKWRVGARPLGSITPFLAASQHTLTRLRVVAGDRQTATGFKKRSSWDTNWLRNESTTRRVFSTRLVAQGVRRLSGSITPWLADCAIFQLPGCVIQGQSDGAHIQDWRTFLMVWVVRRDRGRGWTSGCARLCRRRVRTAGGDQ